MNCNQFRKYVGAFADGELEVPHNLEALGHLNMCPECAARVQSVTHLRGAVVRAFGDLETPPNLRRDVLAALDMECGVERLRPADRVAAFLERLRGALAWPTALTATLLIALLVWQISSTAAPQPGTITVVAGRAMADVQRQHDMCMRKGAYRHHDATLSKHLPTIASRLSDRLGLKVLAPDLSAFGFRLVGGDSCGLNGRPAAHVLYRSGNAKDALSVFTVGRLAALGTGQVNVEAGREYFVSTDRDVRVVAWHEGPQTYLVAGRLPETQLLDIAGSAMATTAYAPDFDAPGLAESPVLAMIDPVR